MNNFLVQHAWRHSLGLIVFFCAMLTSRLATGQVEPDAQVLQAEAARVAAIQRASQATIAVFARAGQGGGSGVIISPDGYALTNFHVAHPAGHAMKCGLPDGQVYDAVIVGLDPTGDVALIKLFGRQDFPHAEITDSDRVRVGDWCFTAGNPFLLADDFQPSVAYGIVSGVHRYQYPAGTLLEYADCIQTDAAINPGNSGGPLFDAAGRLIGINGRGSFEKRGRVNVGVGYAISINQIQNFLGHLKSGRIVDHATLGATVTSDEDGNVVVDNILEDSDAYRRGLRYDDQIVAFGRREIQTVNSFKNVLGIYPRGWRVPLTYQRDGQKHNIFARLAGVHRQGALEKMVRQQSPAGKPPHPRPGQPDDQPAPSHKLPAIVAQHYEARPGYANYYFNRLNRNRVLANVQTLGNFSATAMAWTLTGETSQGADFAVHISDEKGSLRLPEGESKVRFTDELRETLNPPGSGGLLAALHVWQRFLRVDPARFGELVYLGTAPPQVGAPLADVLIGTYRGAETYFYFDPANGQLLAMEFFPDEDVDSAELLFSGYHEVAGRWLPNQIEARTGNRLVVSLQIQHFLLTKPSPEQQEQ